MLLWSKVTEAGLDGKISQAEQKIEGEEGGQ
jgi:hypothetical protein